MKEKELSIVIPAYNEEKRIVRTLPHIIQYLNRKRIDYEIVMIDDGSSDKTYELSRKILTKNGADFNLLKNDKNFGKGYSFKKGFLNSSGKYVLLCDADLSTPIEEVENFLKAIKHENADIVIGIRTQKNSPNIPIKRKKFLRTLSAKSFNKLVNLLFKLNIKDTQCGFKLFKRGKCEGIIEKLITKRFSFDVEILILARKNGLKIVEKRVEWKDSSHSSVRLLKDSIEMISSLLNLKKRY